jgi:hypothetical protein
MVAEPAIDRDRHRLVAQAGGPDGNGSTAANSVYSFGKGIKRKGITAVLRADCVIKINPNRGRKCYRVGSDSVGDHLKRIVSRAEMGRGLASLELMAWAQQLGLTTLKSVWQAFLFDCGASEKHLGLSLAAH